MNQTSASSSSFIFDFEGHEIRYLDHGGKTHFVGMDVVDALEMSPGGTIFSTVPDNEKVVVKGSEVPQRRDLTGKKRGARYTLLTKEGVYRFIMRSDVPKAERFRDWLIYDVFPRLEATGGYLLDEEKAVTAVDVETLLHDFIDKKQAAINSQLEAAYSEVDRLVALKTSIEALKAL